MTSVTFRQDSNSESCRAHGKFTFFVASGVSRIIIRLTRMRPKPVNIEQSKNPWETTSGGSNFEKLRPTREFEPTHIGCHAFVPVAASRQSAASLSERQGTRQEEDGGVLPNRRYAGNRRASM